MKKIMFVCSGNTCRSPMAEGLFKKYLEDNAITDIEVSSAGISAFPGDEVSINSVLALKERGIDISNHRARPINPEMLLETDLFVCMSDSHAAVLSRFCTESNIMVLGVNDPYMQGIEVYEKCCRQIESALPKVLEAIEKLPVIRTMTSDDIKSVAELEKECFSKPWSEKSLSEELINSTARFYTLSNNGELMGYIGANNICDEVYITNVAVGEKYRNNGYGVRLVKYLILQSALENADFVTLEVRKSNGPAIRLYEKCGFEKVGERKNFYSNPTEDALLYTLYLKER